MRKFVHKEDDVVYPLQIGFQVESTLSIVSRNLKKKLFSFLEELKVTGFYKDVSMWNLIFLHTFIAFVLYSIVSVYFVHLPQTIGLNVDTDGNYDMLISKEWLYLPTILHIFIALSTILLNLRACRRLSHLLQMSFFHFFVLAYFEMIGLLFLIRYFLS